MIIKKFGRIYENEKGRIECVDFTIDCEGRSPTDEEFLAEVLIRLRRERLMPDIFQLSGAAAFEVSDNGSSTDAPR